MSHRDPHFRIDEEGRAFIKTKSGRWRRVDKPGQASEEEIVKLTEEEFRQYRLWLTQRTN